MKGESVESTLAQLAVREATQEVRLNRAHERLANSGNLVTRSLARLSVWAAAGDYRDAALEYQVQFEHNYLLNNGDGKTG